MTDRPPRHRQSSKTQPLEPARGDLDRPTSDAESALAGLAVPAREGLVDATPLAVDLADGYDRLPTPIGELVVAWNGRGISLIDRAPTTEAFEAEARAALGRSLRPAPLPMDLRRRLERRLAGDRRVRIPLDLSSRTPFERAVLAKALEIPPGEVRPYSWIAGEIGHPRAVRAVGSALARNPIPLVVPCHRVVRADGRLGAYSLGGPETKRRLLAAEGADLDALEGLARAGVRFVGSRRTGVYCLPSCQNARRIAPRHRIPLQSAEEGRGAGLRPCRVCRPVPAPRRADVPASIQR